jgi:hypothetical protein
MSIPVFTKPTSMEPMKAEDLSLSFVPTIHLTSSHTIVPSFSPTIPSNAKSPPRLSRGPEQSISEVYNDHRKLVLDQHQHFHSPEN